MTDRLSRRELFQTAGAAGVGAAALAMSHSAAAKDASGNPARSSFKYCFNTSTIRGQKIPLPEEIDLIAKAGYSGVEPWIREIDAYVESGGKLRDLKKQIADAGLTVQSAIGFARWIVDDDAERKAGLETAKRDMDLLAQIGGLRIAAPPVGAQDVEGMDLRKIADRYRELLKIGEQAGVTPQIELWGHSKTLHTLGEVAFVAAEAGREDACLNLDVYHIYKGGSNFAGLKTIEAAAISCFHFNDYPDIPRTKIGDADRVYPGDGVAPLDFILQTLASGGFRGHLSLELFNRELWKQDPLAVAKTGLAKMKAAVEKAFA